MPTRFIRDQGQGVPFQCRAQLGVFLAQERDFLAQYDEVRFHSPVLLHRFVKTQEAWRTVGKESI
jgi:hypothetical protein